MKAILQYTDCLQDGKEVFRILSLYNIEILKTRQVLWSICPKITIRIKDYNQLNEIIQRLNNDCEYEVRVVCVKSEYSLFEKIKKLLN